jgi:hypothetical protein
VTVEVGGGPWEEAWRSKCSPPALALGAAAAPLDARKLARDWLGAHADEGADS